MIDSKLIDSSVWIAYLLEGESQEIIESKNIKFISALSLFEIKTKLLKEKMPKEVISKTLKFIKTNAIIIPVDEKVAESSSEVSLKYALHLADAIIYYSAIKSNSELITLDNDFRNLPNAKVISR